MPVNATIHVCTTEQHTVCLSHADETLTIKRSKYGIKSDLVSKTQHATLKLMNMGACSVIEVDAERDVWIMRRNSGSDGLAIHLHKGCSAYVRRYKCINYEYTPLPSSLQATPCMPSPRPAP